MFGSKVLDVGVGLSLLFLFVSLICTAIREMIEAFMKSRAMDLERGLRTLLNDPTGAGYTKLLFDHPLVFSLSSGTYDPGQLKGSFASRPAVAKDGNGETAAVGKPLSTQQVTFDSRIPGFDWGKVKQRKSPFVRKGLPSYIPPAQFAGALLDLIARGPTETTDTNISTAPLSVKSLRETVAKVDNPKLKRALLSAMDTAGEDIDQVRRNVEDWYNGTMDRVAGWYKRRTQMILFFLGLAAAIFLNVDAITIAQRLTQDQALQSLSFDYATKLVPGASTATDENVKQAWNELSKSTVTQLKRGIDDVGYPVGWEGYWPKPQLATLPGITGSLGFWSSIASWLSILLGWLITAVAVTLGAPFWFDVLNKFMIVRSTVKPDEKSPKESSKDAQDTPDAPK